MSELYQGIKFDVQFVEYQAFNDERLTELKKWCNIFHQKNLAPSYPNGSFGNLSFRVKPLENQFLITGTQIGLKENLADDSFVLVHHVNFESKKVFVSGNRKPSSESMLHFALYNARKDVNAIFHGHSPDILANSEQLHLPQTKEEKPYGTIELVESALEIVENHKFFVLKNHGFFSLAENMENCGNETLRILELCREINF